jgi:general secretion pathway protein M
MAAVTDRLRERWERITPRERRLVTLLGVTAVVLVLFWVWMTIAGGLDDIEARNDKKREALKSLARFRADKAAGAGETAAPKVDIPDAPIDLESYLERIGKEVGVEIPGYNGLPEAPKGDYQQVSTKIDVRGVDIVQLKDLLYKIESGGGGAVVVDELRIKREFREEGKLEATIVVSTYYRKGGGESSGQPAAPEKKP